MAKKIIVSGVGCSLIDRLYSNISFSADSFRQYLSKEKGDGGLTPGHLVFREEFEKFKGEGFQSLLKKITSGRKPDKINIGGPAIISMIHAAQISDSKNCEFHFYGSRGNDDDGEIIKSLLEKTPLFYNNYKIFNAETPSTIVLSDSSYDNGNGERIFINSIGSAWEYSPNELNDDFFASDIVVFGGTALVPQIHDNLTELLKKAKSKGCITIVNTVYDFRNEKKNPSLKWPLGNSDESYENIDLLIMDYEEAIRLSGKPSLDEAMQFFRRSGTGAVIVTCGTDNVRLFSNGNLFQILDDFEMPISRAVSKKLKKDIHTGDTTGCGDNFVGGAIASLVSQIQNADAAYDLSEVSIWGIISGGTTCFYIGGMYEEKYFGEKREMIEPYYTKYKQQISE